MPFELSVLRGIEQSRTMRCDADAGGLCSQCLAWNDVTNKIIGCHVQSWDEHTGRYIGVSGAQSRGVRCSL